MIFGATFHVANNTVQTSKACLRGYFLDNTANSATSYYQFFNVAQASVSLGSTVATFVIPVPASGAANLEIASPGVQIQSFAVTTTATGSTAPASAVDATLFYS